MSEDEPTFEEVDQYHMALDEIARLRADLAEAEALLLYANCSREWYDKRDTFLARRNKT